jgi:hypothetical protein
VIYSNSTWRALDPPALRLALQGPVVQCPRPFQLHTANMLCCIHRRRDRGLTHL